MRVENQYSEIFRELQYEQGTDFWAEYKQESTTDERKKEIEDIVFKVLRDKNEVPVQVWNNTLITKELKSFSEVQAENIYKDGKFRFNSLGLSFLRQFFTELLDVRKPTFPMSIRDTFYNDRKLHRVVHKSLCYSKDIMDLIRWLTLCQSGYCTNFRPAAAKTLYEVYGTASNCRVFDSSAGYGARLLGAHFAHNVVEYLGIDPNTAEHCKDEIDYLKKNFDTGTKEQVLKMGSEDFTIKAFPQYQDYFDLYFTSPPYFNTEMYSEDESQSYKKFPTYAGWVTGFYRQTIYNAIDVLKLQGVFCINIFEKVPNIRELTKLFAADRGFYLVREDKYLLATMPGTVNDSNGEPISRKTLKIESYEPIWVFKHYTELFKDGLISEEKMAEYKSRATQDKCV